MNTENIETKKYERKVTPAERFGLQTTGTSCDHGSYYPISAGCTNVRSGTNNGGMSTYELNLAS